MSAPIANDDELRNLAVQIVNLVQSLPKKEAVSELFKILKRWHLNLEVRGNFF